MPRKIKRNPEPEVEPEVVEDEPEVETEPVKEKEETIEMETFHIAPGKAITSWAGVLGPGQLVEEDMFDADVKKSVEIFEKLKKNGTVISKTEYDELVKESE